MGEVTLRTAVVCGDNAFRNVIAEVLQSQVDLAAVVSDLTIPAASLTPEEIDRLQTARPEVVILDLGGDPAAGIRVLRLIGDAAPGRTLIGTGPALAPELLLEGMKAGLAEYLPKPVDPHDLTDALKRAARRAGRGASYAAPTAGRIVTFVGAKGGTGVTTAAANAAVCLHGDGMRRTLLLDLNLEAGNAAVALGLKPRYSIIDLLENFHRVDESLLSSLVVKHKTGIELLAAPLLPESAPEVNGDQIKAALRLLRRQYDNIIVDLGRPYSEFGRAAIDSSDTLFLMVLPDVLAIHSAKRLIPLIRKGIEARAGRLEVVLNRATSADEVSKADVRQALELKDVQVLRRDEQVLLSSINQGEPVAANGKRTKYGEDIRALCTIVGAVAEPEQESGVKRLFTALANLKPKQGTATS